MKTRKLRLLLTLLFALVLLIGLPAVQAQGYTLGEGTCGDDLTWVLDDTGTLTVSGTGAVSAAVEKELKAYSSDIQRLAGAGRHETSVLVANEFFPNAESAVIAYSMNFPDGLSGGPLAHAVRGPLILTVSGDRTPEAYTREKDIHRGYVLGTGELIDDTSARRIFALGTGETVQSK